MKFNIYNDQLSLFPHVTNVVDEKTSEIYFTSNIIGSIDQEFKNVFRMLSIHYSMRSNIKTGVIQLRITF